MSTRPDMRDRIRRLSRMTLPMAPDRPQGFVPQLLVSKLQEAAIVLASLPGERVLMQRMFIDGQSMDFDPDKPLDLSSIQKIRMLAEEIMMVNVLVVPCTDEEDLKILRELVARYGPEVGTGS